MELIRGQYNLAPRHRGCVATIGNFDGVHLGHQAILRRLREAGDRLGLPTLVMSFEPHPLEVFRPEEAPARITPLRDKARALAAAGVDRFLCMPFRPGLAAMTPQAFIDELLMQRLGVHFLIVGDDFRFGRNRAGDFDTLREASGVHGFELERTPTYQVDGARVSSTRVREALAAGDLAGAERLLGHPYTLSGRVVHGDRIGRELGFPTANIRLRRRPAMDAILVADVDLGDGPRPGIASMGTRPSVGGRKAVLEVYLLAYSGSLYGRHLQVTFRHWLRGQEHYDSLDALRAQIGRDVEAARAWYGLS